MPYTIVEPRAIFLLYAIAETGEALRALKEVRRLAGVRIERQPGVEVREWRSIIRELRAALAAAANVSKVLWPPKNSKDVSKARSIELRRLCNLPGEHGLKSRQLRNHIEHADERLDEWLASGPRPFLTIEHVLHAEPIMPAETRAEAAAACVMVYDVTTDVVTFVGHPFCLAEIEAQLSAVQINLGQGLSELIKG